MPAEFRELLPGIQSGGVAVAPGDFQGVVPREGELDRMNPGRNGCGIEQSFAGDFVDADGEGHSQRTR